MSYVYHSLCQGCQVWGRIVPCRQSPALELCLPAADGRAHGGGGFSSLRALRMLRVLRSLKLLREIKGLNRLLTLVLKASNTALCKTACATPAAGRPGSHQGGHQQCHQRVSDAEHAGPSQLVAVWCSLYADSDVATPLSTSLQLFGSLRVPFCTKPSPINIVLLLSCRVSEPSRT